MKWCTFNIFLFSFIYSGFPVIYSNFPSFTGIFLHLLEFSFIYSNLPSFTVLSFIYCIFLDIYNYFCWVILAPVKCPGIGYMRLYSLFSSSLRHFTEALLQQLQHCSCSQPKYSHSYALEPIRSSMQSLFINFVGEGWESSSNKIQDWEKTQIQEI